MYVKKFKEANMDVSLNSNLYLLEKEDSKVLGDLNLNYLLSSILSFEEKLGAVDLNSDFKERITESVKESILSNEPLMAEIREFVEEENADNVEGRVSNKDYVNLKVDEMASDAVDKTRIYCDFDGEVKL